MKGGLGLDHGTTINAVDEVGPDSCFGVSDFCLASCEHSSEQQKPPTTIRHQPLYGGRPSRSQPGLEMSNVGVSKECAGHTPGSQEPRLDLRPGVCPAHSLLTPTLLISSPGWLREGRPPYSGWCRIVVGGFCCSGDPRVRDW